APLLSLHLRRALERPHGELLVGLAVGTDEDRQDLLGAHYAFELERVGEEPAGTRLDVVRADPAVAHAARILATADVVDERIDEIVSERQELDLFVLEGRCRIERDDPDVRIS